MNLTDVLAQQLINGLVAGIGYVLVALGLTLILGIMDVLNFAHGEFYMLGAVLTFTLTSTLGLPYFLAIIIAVLIVMVIGAIVERVALRPVYGKDHMTPILVTFAVSLFFISFIEMVWGKSPEKVISPLKKTIQIGNIYITEQKIFIVVMGCLMIAVLYFLINRTRLGKMMRAVAQNRTGAMAVGINIQAIYTATFVIGSGITAFSAALIAPTLSVTATMGAAPVMKAFAVVILGGMGSVPGAIVGGLLIGIMESFGAGFISSAMKDLVAYSVIVLVLLLKPAGLLSKKGGI